MSQSVLLLRREFIALRMDLAWEFVMMSLGAMLLCESLKDLKLPQESENKHTISHKKKGVTLDKCTSRHYDFYILVFLSF